MQSTHCLVNRKLKLPIGAIATITLLALLWLQRDRLGEAIDTGASQVEPLTLGTNIWPGYEPIYLARNLGHYDDRVRLVEYSSATEVIRALRNGLIDMGALTLDELLLLRESGVDMKVVLVTDISDGGDVVMARPEIGSLAELKGRKVAVESSALGAYVLTRALQTVNLKPSDVRVKQIEVDRHLLAYREGTADAVVTFEPVMSRLKNEGAKVLFDSSKISGEIVDVLAVRTEVLGVKNEHLRLLVDGWFKALAHLSERPDDAGRRMADRLQLTSEEVLQSYNGLKLPTLEENRVLLNESNSSSLLASAEKLAQVMREENLLAEKPTLSGLLAPQFVSDVGK